MKIELKQNNRPTEPGWYIYRDSVDNTLCEVRLDRNGDLWEVHLGYHAPLDRLTADWLWSDRLEIEVAT